LAAVVEEALGALVAGTADQAQLERIKADPKLERAMLSQCPLHRLIGKGNYDHKRGPTSTIVTAEQEPGMGCPQWRVSGCQHVGHT
jgi:hypothetical protein